MVTRAVITELNDEKQRAVLETTCTVGGEVVLEGEALVKVPSRQATG